MVGQLGEALAVYHCIDDFTAVRYPLTGPTTIAEMEAELCRRVDLVLTRTAELAAAKRAFNPATHYLPGGVEPALFDPAREYALPPALAQVPPPRAGFLGTLDDRIDTALLAAAAQALPEVSFVLVGPRKGHLIDLKALEARPNIHFAPACPHDQAPATMVAFDVCLIPYRVNRYTQGLSPLKLYEYLAMGKPVVATDLPYLRREADKIALVQGADEFVAAVSAALAAPGDEATRAQRRAAATAFSWDAQVEKIESLLADALRAKQLQEGAQA
jgi:UDP-galactopyranose mutase